MWRALLTVAALALIPAFSEATNCLPSCVEAHGNLATVGNKKCNSVNNNCACDWDGGDCCGDSGSSTQYSTCGGSEAVCCHDPKFSSGSGTTTNERDETRSPPTTHSRSPSPEGRDRATTTLSTRALRTTTTVTRQSVPERTTRGTSTTTQFHPHSTFDEANCGPTCLSTTMHTILNGKCNSPNNNCACGWDGGDCCGNSGIPAQYETCGGSEAVCCLNPHYDPSATTRSTTRAPETTTKSVARALVTTRTTDSTPAATAQATTKATKATTQATTKATTQATTKATTQATTKATTQVTTATTKATTPQTTGTTKATTQRAATTATAGATTR
jgi:hypothetical protein